MTVPAPRKPFMKAAVAGIESAGADIRIIRLSPESPLHWKAGQYIRISFADHLPPRPYSIACAPGSGHLEIHIKRGAGEVSRHVMDKLAQGDEVSLYAPEGSSVLEDREDRPILAVAGGLGITPLKALAEEAMENRGLSQPFILYWGVADKQSAYLRRHFETMASSHPPFTFRLIAGPELVTAALDRDFKDFSGYRIYISGPPAMIAATIALLRAKGADPAAISYDRHPEAAPPAARP